MQFRTLLLSAFAALAMAQSQTSSPTTTPTRAPTTSPTGNPNSIVGLVQQLPQCALGCLQSAATNINCSPGNFQCLCSNAERLATNIGVCVLTSCGSGEIERLSTLTTRLCAAINNNPPPAQVASASGLVISALNAASTSSSRGAAAARKTDGPVLAVMGGAAAAWAAYAM